MVVIEEIGVVVGVEGDVAVVVSVVTVVDVVVIDVVLAAIHIRSTHITNHNRLTDTRMQYRDGFACLGHESLLARACKGGGGSLPVLCARGRADGALSAVVNTFQRWNKT